MRRFFPTIGDTFNKEGVDRAKSAPLKRIIGVGVWIRRSGSSLCAPLVLWLPSLVSKLLPERVSPELRHLQAKLAAQLPDPTILDELLSV